MKTIQFAKALIFGLTLVTLASSAYEQSGAGAPNMLCSCIERGVDPRDPSCRPLVNGPGSGEVAGMPNGAAPNGVMPPGALPNARGPAADHQ